MVWNLRENLPEPENYILDNFTFETVEECKIIDLGDREKYYIEKYNTYKNGYNSTAGGEDNCGESHPGHKLTKDDIIDIKFHDGITKAKVL